jgi:GTPase SAR1 family protein
MDEVAFEDYDLKLCGLITIVGVSNSGKTILLRAIINKLLTEGLEKIYVYSSTADIYRYSDYDFARPCNVRNISMDSITKLVEAQKIIVTKGARDKRIIPKWICIVLDDFIGSESCNLASKNAAIISRLAVSSRHYKICLIVLTQHLNKAPPVIRCQSNYIFVTKTNMDTVREGIFKLQTQYTNKNQLWDLYNKHTKTRYSSMLFQSTDPYDKNIYWLKPAKLVQFIKDDDSAEIIREVELSGNRLKSVKSYELNDNDTNCSDPEDD